MLKLTNVASATLSAGLTNIATTMTLTTGNGSLFPALGAGEFFYGTLIDTSNNMEIVKVTARTADSLTIVRGQDGTTARAFNTGDKFELRLVAAVFTEFVQRDGSVAMTAALNHGGFKSTNMADPTAAQDGATKNYVDNTAGAVKVSKSGDTMTGALTLPAATVSSTAPSITMNDTNWGNRYVYSDGGLMGFLDNTGNWAMYENNSGGVWTKAYGWLTDYFFSTVSNCLRYAGGGGNTGNCQPGAANVINCYGGGNMSTIQIELLDNGNNVGMRAVNYLYNCNCNCACNCCGG
jgi:hypothetical protein